MHNIGGMTNKYIHMYKNKNMKFAKIKNKT